MSLSLFNLLYLTISALSSKPLRSALTMLGIFMGSAAVSATLQVRSISQEMIAQELAQRGAPQVSAYPQWQPTGPNIDLREEDMEFLKQRLDGLFAVSAFNWAGPTSTLFQAQEATPVLSPVSQSYLLTSGRELVQGRFFTAKDFTNYRAVAVIDQFLANQLFGEASPLEQQISVAQRPYVVVGVVKTAQQEDAPPEGQILVPTAIYNALRGDHGIGSVQMRPHRLEDLERLSEQAEELLEERFPNQTFLIWNNVEDILQQQKILQMATRGLTVMGGIALLIGGVGIANIMIASVTERTSEIGLRRALGATQREIMLQLLLEAMLLSLVGGTVSVGVVHGLTLVVTDAFDLVYQFKVASAALAVGSALIVGVGAGFVPALQASRLDPGKALRSQ